MYEWNDWIRFIHVASAFGFFMAHGASAAVALRLRRERDPARVGMLLDLSRAAMGPITSVVFLVMVVTGITLGFRADWWGAWWIWISIAILAVIGALMTPLGTMRLNRMRAALGLSVDPKKPTPVAVSRAELEAILDEWDPRLLATLGLGGLMLIVALMVLKPF